MTNKGPAFPWLRVVAVAVGFAALDELVIVPAFASVFGLMVPPMPLPSRMAWAFVSAIVVAWALAFVAGRARAGVEQLFVAFFVTLAGLKLAAHAQAVYFFQPDVDARTFTGAVLKMLSASAVLASAAAAMFHDRDEDVATRHSTAFHIGDLGWLWRVPASAAAYFVLFLIAGLTIWPFVQDFYATQLEQDRLGLLMFEWEYLNGVWFTVIALPLLRLIPGGRTRAGVTIGAAFCLIRGVGGLVVPSPYLPAAVRLWHMFEVGWSNFVFGLAVAWLFLPRQRDSKPGAPD